MKFTVICEMSREMSQQWLRSTGSWSPTPTRAGAALMDVPKNTVKWRHRDTSILYSPSLPLVPQLYPIMECAFSERVTSEPRFETKTREDQKKKKKKSVWSRLVVPQTCRSTEKREDEGRGWKEINIFFNVATQASANDSKHHEKIWE